MTDRKIIIAIDGYSSTGKSTFAKRVALELGYIYIDTGALYRAVTLYAIEHNLILDDNSILYSELSSALCNISIDFRATGENGQSETYLNNMNVEKEIRTLKVSNKVSHIAVVPFVREYVDKRLIEIGRNKGVVMDGRDIGTAVFPNAELKVFMVADPKIRAERRLKEMTERGENPTFDDVMKNILDRDYIDSHRQTNPLSQASDAILLDNSYMTVDDQMSWILNIIENDHSNR